MILFTKAMHRYPCPPKGKDGGIVIMYLFAYPGADPAFTFK